MHSHNLCMLHAKLNKFHLNICEIMGSDILPVLPSDFNCLLSNLSHFFFKINFFKKRNSGIPSSLDSDQHQHFDRPDLGPICLQRLSADDTRRQS